MKVKSLGQVLTALINLVKTLFHKMPVLIIPLIYVIDLGVRSYLEEGFSQTFLMMCLILFASFGIYLSTESFAETTLSFILGVLTVFTIDWNEANIFIFLFFYLIFLIIVFYASSIKMISKQETILIQATNKLANKSDYNHVFKKLKKIASMSTVGNQLTIIQKSEIIRYLAYRQMPIGEFEDSINSIEVIYSISQIPINDATEVFYNFYMYSKLKLASTNHAKEVLNFYDLIVTVPISYTDFYLIYTSTKRLLFEGTMNFQDYIVKVKILAIKGYDTSEIVSELKELMQKVIE